MTDQEVFDTVVTALRRQGCKSVKRVASPRADQCTPVCRYRGENGTKCAVGHLIPDELYDRRMEGLCWTSIVLMSPELYNMQLSNRLVCRLQEVHDCAPVRNWESCWREVAHKYGLTYTPPENENQ